MIHLDGTKDKMEKNPPNLRELIASRGVTMTFIAGKLDMLEASLSRRVAGVVPLKVMECRIIAEWLHASMDEVVAAAEETQKRPGEVDSRGRRKPSLGGEKKNGATIKVGLGSSGHGALAPHV